MNAQITPADLRTAREAFEANEARDLFYRAATELVDLALRNATSLSVAEALAVLLQTWNMAHYRYRKFDKAHFTAIERVEAHHRDELILHRARHILDVDDSHRENLCKIFRSFELILGPVGAAKALHLLAPRLFPLWDRAIAQAYGLRLGRAGTNSERYWRLITVARQQCASIYQIEPEYPHILKAIDEYNYCRYTKGWLT